MAKFTWKVKNILQRKWLGATLLGGSVAKAQIGFYLVLMLIKLHIQMWVEWLHILSDSSLIKSSNDPKKKKILSKSTRYCRPAGSWEFLKSVLFFLFFRPSLDLFHFGHRFLFMHALVMREFSNIRPRTTEFPNLLGGFSFPVEPCFQRVDWSSSSLVDLDRGWNIYQRNWLHFSPRHRWM